MAETEKKIKIKAKRNEKEKIKQSNKEQMIVKVLSQDKHGAKAQTEKR